MADVYTPKNIFGPKPGRGMGTEAAQARLDEFLRDGLLEVRTESAAVEIVPSHKALLLILLVLGRWSFVDLAKMYEENVARDTAALREDVG